jgi:hypothetical protein
MARSMNDLFARLYGPQGNPHCAACYNEAVQLGPVQGCDPPRYMAWRWGMTPAEWAGEPPRREY